ncbi:hypothetical protein EKO27_g10013 [Xylaria grammica]|uniref:Uncharacterized protein n=1 Tax=Xylaria grammica TaxID=363999 RepID=A0A439CSE9_9PEZI|nr:hypothetical protein EKO27_g10013 [Xylaria grammica]
MPAKKSIDGVASTYSTATSKPFELPALDLTFGSLTDGTNIPPPPPSPKEEQPPPQPRTVTKKENVEGQQLKPEANGATNGTSPHKPEIAITTNAGLKRTADEVPISPARSGRGSLRRLISKTFLNHAYDEQGSIIGHDTSRPPSRTASVVAEEKKTKRSSGWFRRLRSHDHANDDKPATLQFENVTKKPIGPPPPMIPELSALETKVDTHLGDDLFKGIGRDL